MRKGFTLIELLVVVMMVAILTGVALPQYRRAVRKAEATEAQSMLRIIYDSSERLVAEMGYKTYADLYAAGKGKLSRMDMFGSGNRPTHCTMADYELFCNKFDYNLYPSSNPRYITAQLRNVADSKKVTFVFDRNTQSIYCQDYVSDSLACDIYGLDTIGSL